MRVFVAVVLVLVCVSLGLYLWQGSRPVAVQVVQVERATLQVGYDEDGFVRSDVEAKVAPRVAGRVRSIDARDGADVVRGQTIATLDARELEAAIDAAEADASRARAARDDTVSTVRTGLDAATADMTAARAALAGAEARRDQVRSGARDAERQRARALKAQADAAAWEARRTWQREDHLYTAGYVPQRQLDAALSALRQAEARQRQADAEWRLVDEGARSEERRTAEAQVTQAQAAVDAAQSRVARARASQAQIAAAQATVEAAEARARQARAQRSDVVLAAPFSGSLVLQDVSVGDVLGPGTLVARVVDPRRVYVEAQIDERDLSGVRIGMPVRVTTDTFPDVVFTARLTAMQGEAVQKRRGFSSAVREEDRVFKTRVEVDDPSHHLRPGMTVYVQIVTETLRDVLVLPREAVQPVGETWVAWRVEGGRAFRKTITLGAREVRRVQVTSGLSQGDAVVIAGREKLVEGCAVQTSSSGAPAPAP